MKKYNPSVAPQQEQWLSLDEQTRLDLVGEYHRRAGDRLPNLRLHATLHVVVENQLAEGVPEVTAALGRLMDEGLDRHDAIHAVGSVLAKRLYDALQGNAGQGDINSRYYQDLQNLTAESWHRSYDSQE